MGIMKVIGGWKRRQGDDFMSMQGRPFAPGAANGHFGNGSPKRTEVAVVGSPNTVIEAQFDVRNAHLQTPLLGALLSLTVPVHGHFGHEELLVLGQVARIETQNRWH